MGWGDAWDKAQPVIGGIIAAGGQMQTNEANKDLAREQMEFQERMSNTSAQRSVADYRAAGLNPALAYERGASTPGGASTTINSAAAQGISTAMQAKQLMLAQQQSKADLGVKRSQENLNTAAAAKAVAEQTLANMTARNAADQGALLRQTLDITGQRYNFEKAQQPYQLRMNAADAIIRELGIPGARAEAEFQSKYGKLSRGISTAKNAAGILKPWD